MLSLLSDDEAATKPLWSNVKLGGLWPPTAGLFFCMLLFYKKIFEDFFPIFRPKTTMVFWVLHTNGRTVTHFKIIHSNYLCRRPATLDVAVQFKYTSPKNKNC